MKLEMKTNEELVKMWMKYTEKTNFLEAERKAERKHEFGHRMSNVEFTNIKLQQKVGKEILKRYFGDKAETKDYIYWMFGKEIWKKI